MPVLTVTASPVFNIISRLNPFGFVVPAFVAPHSPAYVRTLEVPAILIYPKVAIIQALLDGGVVDIPGIEFRGAEYARSFP